MPINNELKSLLGQADAAFEVDCSDSIRMLENYYVQKKLALTAPEKIIVLSRLGGYYADSDKPVLALVRLKAAKKFFEKNKANKDAAVPLMEEITLRIADCLFRLENYESAIFNLKEISAEAMGITKAHTFFILAKCYGALHKTIQAEYYFDGAILLYKDNLIDPRQMLDVLIEKASFCFESGSHKLKYLTVSLKKLLDNTDVEYGVESEAVARLYVGIGNLYDGQYFDAMSYLDQACEMLEKLYKETNDLDWLVQVANCKLYLAKAKWRSQDADGAYNIIQSVVNSIEIKKIPPETQILFLLCQVSYGQKKWGPRNNVIPQAVIQLLAEPKYAAIKNSISAMFDVIGVDSEVERKEILLGALMMPPDSFFSEIKRSHSEPSLLKRGDPTSQESPLIKKR